MDEKQFAELENKVMLDALKRKDVRAVKALALLALTRPKIKEANQ